MIFIFLSSGLFLGWSLGANDASNIFGTAVSTKMIRFKTAAIIASLFVLIGAITSGSGAAHTLGKLGAVNALAGSFMVALASAFTVFWMTRLQLPVSVSQAIVGAIIGWNFFSSKVTDFSVLGQILSTWILCPVLAAIFSALLFYIFRFLLNRMSVHLLRLDMFNRAGLVIAGAFGAYSLGANNIANVMGVFVPVVPFQELNFYGLFTLSSAQQLFLLGGLAIGVGIFTYSYKVMGTVGGNLYKLSPVGALVVVIAESLVLFLFSSEYLEAQLIKAHLPTIPLVPVSSTQAVIGAVIGIALARGGRGIRYRILGEIALGWVTTPVASGLITFVALFILQNVFSMEVSRKVEYDMSPPVINYLLEQQISDSTITRLNGKRYQNSMKLAAELRQKTGLNSSARMLVIEAAEIYSMHLSPEKLSALDRSLFTEAQIASLRQLSGNRYIHKWAFMESLKALSTEWHFKPNLIENKPHNKQLRIRTDYLLTLFRETETQE